jgi:homoserine O-acetyltransferase
LNPTAEDFTAEQHDAAFSDYRFRNGEVLDELRLHYATAGTPARNGKGEITNAVLMLHWTTGSGAALCTPEFVSSLYGPGMPLDAAKTFLVFADSVGHGLSSKPSDGLRAKFPRYGYRDMVDLQRRLVSETLGIERLRAIVGLSMGGMHAWLWAEIYPDAVEAILPVVAMPMRISGRNLVWRRIVARQIRSDPSFQGGDYAAPPRGWTEAFPLFRMMLDGVPRLQEAVPDLASADDFVEAAVQYASAIDANDVLYALEASEDCDPEPALELIRARVFALSFADDEFNPVSLGILEKLIPRIPGARFVVLPGAFGHLTQAFPSLWAEQVRNLGL